MPEGNLQQNTFFSVFKEAERLLRPVWGDASKSYVEFVLFQVFDLSRETFVLQLKQDVPSEKLDNFFSKINRLKEGEPLAYVLKSAYFCDVEYDILPGVLIPRPETEKVVGIVESLCRENEWDNVSVFELGFGSGVLSLELAKRLVNSRVMGWDISQVAYDVASLNLSKFGLDNVRLFHGDFFAQDAVWRQRGIQPTVIVSNPPYIQRGVIDTLDFSVKEFEPFEALCGGEDGLDFYRQFLGCIPFCDAMVLEIGYDLKESLENIFEDYMKDCSFEKDFSGLDRYFIYLKPR